MFLHYLKYTGSWMKQRWIKIPERDSQLTVWFLASFAIITTVLAVLAALGAPTGPSMWAHSLNIAMFVLLNYLFLCVGILIASLLFSFMYVPLPRIFLAGFTYTISATVIVFHVAKSGLEFSMLAGALSGAIALVLGLLFMLIFHLKISRTIKIAGLIGLVAISIFFIAKPPNFSSVAVPAFSETTDTDNPAQLGNYDPILYTYGSGIDPHREEFGEAVDFETKTVDASEFVTRWSNKRGKFWGFTQENLPINGRAWVPDGDGPFPVFLIVHGNHTMEYFSTGGYDYLGELLASRGFITISVDEDFINYSSIYGSPNRNYELRTWVMLQHLVQLQQMNEMPGNFLFNKIDFQNVAYAGHSRGGQAALMAADYKRFFPDDETLATLEDIDVKGVVAISPTDKSVDSKRAEIHNTSYLLLHGARDADVSAFRDAPFYRTTFDQAYDGFKTSLYIADANHTHFNTDWGSMDISLPRGIFLNQQTTLSPEAQQEIAKVYISAFLERIFNKTVVYEELFQNYQNGLAWLPATTYVNKYQSARYNPLITFRANDLEALDVEGFTELKIDKPLDRDDNKRKTNALELTWKNEATYTLDIDNKDIENADKLSFTMANIDVNNLPNIQLEVELNDGTTHILPFNDYTPFPPVITTEFTKFGLFENSFRDEKYTNAWEPVFQSFHIPLASLEISNINDIRLKFVDGAGSILIEEIGVE